VYISTDYVFDGKSPPYAHDAPTSPVNLYGQTKLQGEQVVLSVDPSKHSSGRDSLLRHLLPILLAANVVLRVPVLYGPVEYLGESAVTVLLETLQKAPSAVDGVAVSDVEVRRPSHVRDIASVVQQLIETKIKVLLPILTCP
jgi:dTDP-4-dehydrorhamnose reductase